MNLVVHPNGTVELDEQSPADAARTALRAKGWGLLALTMDRTRIGQAMYLPSGMANGGQRNIMAQTIVADLTGVHIQFHGVVVLADLSRDLAHRIIEELQQR